MPGEEDEAATARLPAVATQTEQGNTFSTPKDTALVMSRAYAAKRSLAWQGSLFLHAFVEVINGLGGSPFPFLRAALDTGILLTSDRFLGCDADQVCVLNGLAPGDLVLSKLIVPVIT